jgi:hypothetical protein
MLRFGSRGLWFFLFLFLFTVAACSGGAGCSGCSGCGSTPLAGGFPKASVISNAASARLTRPGLDFIGQNFSTVIGKVVTAPGGLLTFDIPKTSTNISIPILGTETFTICPNGADPNAAPPTCVVDIQIGQAKFRLDAITPHSVKISGTIPLDLEDAPVSGSGIIGIGANAGVGANASCSGTTPSVSLAAIPVEIELPIVTEPLSPRDGYSYIDVESNNAVINVNFDSNDITLCCDTSIPVIGTLCSDLLTFIVQQFSSTIIGDVQSAVKSQLENALCTKPVATQTPPCPTNTEPDDAGAKCVFDSDPTQCVPILLGTEGHFDLTSLLASISPGASAALDFTLAAGGDMNPAPGDPENDAGQTDNGITLGFVGGALPQPQSKCVPVFSNPLPQNIPIPDEMIKDKQTPWPTGDNGPDFGIALAGRFLDYALGSAYNSGALCLGISTESVQTLQTGILSLIVPSIKGLTFENKPGPVAITTRPQQPPTVVIGGGTDIKKDPLLSITLKQFALDFYVWSDDRFVRAFTFTSDVTVPVNLSTAKDPQKNPNGGILPVLGDLGIVNSTVTNADLLLDDPATIASGFQGILGSIVGQFLGNGFKAFSISSALSSYGLALTIPDGGIRKLTKGTDNYVAIFADLATGTVGSWTDTTAVLRGKHVDADAMSLGTAERRKFPTLDVTFGSPQDDGTRKVEYSWWVDDLTRSPWSTETMQTLDSQFFLLQGKHTLYVTSRLVGAPHSEDPTPAAVPFVIDTLPPHVTLTRKEDGTVAASAWDFVSDEDHLTARARATDMMGRAGAWTDWQALSDLTNPDVSGASAVELQVADEEGNVGDISLDLIRGGTDGTIKAAGSTCGCTVPGGGADRAATIAASASGLALLGLVVLRRRRQETKGAALAPGARRFGGAVAFGAAWLLAATNEGCACGSSGGSTPTTGCGSDCNQTCGPALTQGLIGSYTSLAVASDGTIWVAGYNESDGQSPPNLYGDLVVGRYDTGKSLVDWQTVDGLPTLATGTCPVNDPTGWRGGLGDPGDDVGLWTSIQLGSNNLPMVSYYDATNAALKFASYDGTTWHVHTVLAAAQSDIGRYSKMLIVGGNPVIAFLIMEPGDGGKLRTKVTLAHGGVAVPASASDWTLEDAVIDESGPCRASFCPSGQQCIQETGICQASVSGCTPADCGASTSTGIGSTVQTCVSISGKPTCGTVIGSSYLDTYPEATGDYVSLGLGSQGLAMVMYDRIRGNLVGVTDSGGKWTAANLDGQIGANTDPNRKDTGDVGVGANLFVAPNGDWHVSYVNGWTETLEYMIVPGGNVAATTLKPEIVDDGYAVAGNAFPDGQHIVGDDSQIRVDASGVVNIFYQDATAGTLRRATGTLGQGGLHTWTTSVVAQQGKFAGFFPHALPDLSQVANYWRQTDHTNQLWTGNVSLVVP